jgi:hypothetical protein
MSGSRPDLYLAISVILFAGASAGGATETMHAVTFRSRQEIDADKPSILAPALLATKDSRGKLIGAISHGDCVIAASLERLKESRAVKSVSDDIPSSWIPVKRLKLSYKANERPTDENLQTMHLKLIEDYEKGSFMIVEIVEGEIDANFCETLESNPHLRYITLSLQVKATE